MKVKIEFELNNTKFSDSTVNDPSGHVETLRPNYDTKSLQHEFCSILRDLIWKVETFGLCDRVIEDRYIAPVGSCFIIKE